VGRPTGTRLTGTAMLSALMALVVAGPVPIAGHQTPSEPDAPQAPSADLATALGADGTFRGAPGVAGTIDASAWTLTSDLASGEPPRFAPAAGDRPAILATGARPATPTARAAPTAPTAPAVGAARRAGPWAALGSNAFGHPAFEGEIEALAVVGIDLYVGGKFTDAAGIPEADYVARWDGTTWSALGSDGAGDGAINDASGFNTSVRALAVSGTDLYVGGFFVNSVAATWNLARWNGSTWSAVGSSASSVISGYVRGLTVSGSDLYVSGYFHDAAGIAEADFVVKWDRTSWSALGSDGAGDGAIRQHDGELTWVNAVAVVGTQVYVGGMFRDVARIHGTDNIAMWNGSNWSAVGTPATGDGAIQDEVNALAVLATDLYVAGSFGDVAGIPEADGIARWDGTAWSAVGPVGPGTGAITDAVLALAVSGTDLIAGGRFTDAAGIASADHVATWDGTAWSPLGSIGNGNGAINGWVWAIAISGPAIHVGGSFTAAGGDVTADDLATWDGRTWSGPGSTGAGDGALDGVVQAFAVRGTDLYVGGGFTNAAGIPEADHVAKWDGTRWSALGSNGSGDGAIDSTVFVLAVFRSDLYVGGRFLNAGNIPEADLIAKWNGTSWSAVGPGGGNDRMDRGVYALAVSGPDLYVGGTFSVVGLRGTDYLARWNGTAWSAVGPVPLRLWYGYRHYRPAVHALAVSGGDLYVGGNFSDAAAIPRADYLVKWDGRTWSALGSDGAGNGALDSIVWDLAVSGTDVYVGGRFTHAAGIRRADYLARWNGRAWSALGSNGSGNGALNGPVRALTVSHDVLFVGGDFANGARIPTADHLARWNGRAWSAVGAEGSGDGAISGPVYGLAASGTDLFVGGSFTNAAGIATADRLAKWHLRPGVARPLRLSGGL
jgi:hypothetical protein